MAWFKTLAVKLFAATQGKSTAFFIAFFLTGNALAYFGKLTGEYVAFMGTLGGLVLGHSIKEDVVELKRGLPGGAHVDEG